MWNWVRRIVDKNGSVLTLLIGGAVMLTPFYIALNNKSKSDAKESEVIRHTAERVKFYDEYMLKSQQARVEVVAASRQQSKDIKEIKEGILLLISHNEEAKELDNKFYHLNPHLVDPRYAIKPILIPQTDIIYANK